MVVHFWADWSPQCKQVDDVIKELAKRTPSATFARVEAEAVVELSEKFTVTAVPTVVLLKVCLCVCVCVCNDVCMCVCVVFLCCLSRRFLFVSMFFSSIISELKLIIPQLPPDWPQSRRSFFCFHM